MTTVEVLILNPEISDHSPLKMVLDKTCRGDSKSFRFFNFLAKHPTFITSLEKAWHIRIKGDMKLVLEILKRVKNNIK